MDYGFVPGIGDPALEDLRTEYAARPNTVVTLTDKAATLADFFGAIELGVDTLGWAKAGELLLAAHGNERGTFFMALDASTPSPATYETLQASTSIKIPADVGDANTSAVLGSCQLGSDDTLPTLRALKKALGTVKSVSSPRYVHAHVTYLQNLWEFMMYDFIVFDTSNGATPLADRNAVLAELAKDTPGLKDVNGNTIAAEQWQAWMPAAAKLNFSPGAKQDFWFDLPTLGPLVVVPTQGRWTAGQVWVMPAAFESDAIPVGRDVEIDMLKTALLADTKYQDTYGYPVYRRYQCATLDEFVNAYQWKVTPNDGTTKNYSLQYVGSRYEYRLGIPVTAPGSLDLIYNRYPKSGSPTINFTEKNEDYKLYGTV